jgi:hypothetical protein
LNRRTSTSRVALIDHGEAQPLANDVVDRIGRAHLPNNPQAHQSAAEGLAQALELLPNPEERLLEHDDEHVAHLHLLAGNRLYSVDVGPSEGTFGLRVTIGTRSLEGVVVGLDQHGREGDVGRGPGYRRDWQFRFPGEDEPLRISGVVYTDAVEPRDAAERFAEALAGRAGWTIAGGGGPQVAFVPRP